MNTVTRHYKAMPVDRSDIRMDPEYMRKAVHNFLAYWQISVGRGATLDEVSKGLEYNRFKTKARLTELISRGMARISPTTLDRSLVYEGINISGGQK
jgi:hypothetical protein